MSPRCSQVAKILKTMSPLLCLQLLTGCSARHPMGLTPVAVRLAGAVPDVVLAAGVGERCAVAAAAVVPRAGPTRARQEGHRLPATADGVAQGHPDRSAARRHHGALRSRGRDSEDPRRARRLATADAGLLMLMCH